MLPTNYKLLYSAREIQEAIARIGAEVSRWATEASRHTGRDTVAIPVLRGGVYFFADLTRTIQCSIEMAPIRARAYAGVENAVQRASVEVGDHDFRVDGCAVLLVDDICDSGRTLRVLSDFFREQGASEVRTAALVRRLRTEPTFEPDWTVFEYSGPEWFVGFGMDDTNRWRNLPDIYLIEPPSALAPEMK